METLSESLPAKFIQPALLHEPAGERVRCRTCERRCEIAPGEIGWCRTRSNQNGAMVTLVYGSVSSLSVNPIEKKPLYHFHPGTLALTVGTWSCNFACPWCRNCHLSRAAPRGGRYISPEGFVSQAIDLNCQGTSISFNEPTLSLEWSLDVFRLTGSRHLYNTYVTNGYMTPEALRLLANTGLDAMNVDIKGDARAVRQHCNGIDVEHVWRNCLLAQQLGVHLEITTLVIPGVTDKDEVLRGIAERIVSELGTDVPWHVSAYFPAHRFTTPPTPMSTLERVYYIGREAGLAFVYLGNVAGHQLQSTYCPDCQSLLVGRSGLLVTAFYLRQGHCPGCGREIPGVWGR